MTPFEQLLQDLTVERMRPTPPPPARLDHTPTDAGATPIERQRLVREVEPADACELARRGRVRRLSTRTVRWLTDEEIEAI